MGTGTVNAFVSVVDASGNPINAGNTSGQFVQGTVASGVADAGNPVKTGGAFNTTQPTVTTGQRVDFQATARGAAIVATGADPFSVVVPGNADTAALLTYAAAAAGTNGTDQTNLNGRGVKIVVDITTLAGTAPTLTITLQGKDAASGKYYAILTSTALAAVATTVLTVYPGTVAAANITANDVLPRVWRVIATIAGTAPAVTATVGASVII